MKYLVISDLHLNKKFNKKKMNFLEKLIESCDRLIINGDFWDADLIKAEEFIKTEWAKLFELIKSKSAIYLHGNHDPQRLTEGVEKLFSKIQGMEFDIEIAGKKFHFEHGHRLYDTDWINKYLGSSGWFYKVRMNTGSLIEQFLMNIPRGLSFLERTNRKFEEFWSHQNTDKILVCGHSHTPILNLAKNFMNSGFMKYGFASYIMIEDENINLIKTSY